MMQYLLLCCFDEDRWDKLPATERDRIMQEYGKFQHDLAASGQYRAGAKLGSIETATTLRERAGKPVITDGPFAETKEHLGGYHLIDCEDLDEAIAIARRIPTLRAGGAVEVRPVESGHQA
ncbi:MAG TPA: YciI family protein [Casimicrobiaceae bacterium]|jgi:hypothetical protein|nr:YciI family protein [Casimicrobiaceae bacterium]